jgi:DNA-binding CsgD family transcriptional regulator
VVGLCQDVHRAVDAAVPADRWCGFALDPSTLFATNGYHDEGVAAHLVPRLLELEHGTPDTNLLPALARTTAGVATLGGATGGDPAVSARWRDVIAPSGLAHEMRAVFRHGGHAWGALILFRGGDVADFTPAETQFLARVAPTVAIGFRRVLVHQHLDHGDDAREAGILVLGGDPPEVRTATSAARSWLAQLDDGGMGGDLPTPVVSAVHAARVSSNDRPAAVRARTRAGRWVTITAEVVDGASAAAGGDVGVIVQPSRPAEIAQIVGAAHGLTNREADVVLLVASGHTNDEIARALALSRYTVADHLKRVFQKLDVVTRGELTSKLFFDHYLPRVVGDRKVGTDGWFLPD